MEFKSVHIYYILVFATILFFIFHKDTIEVPQWATICFLFLMLIMAADQSWKAFKRQGRASIIVSLKPDEGGHSTIHPDDISIAVSPTSGEESLLPNFCVFVTGGFVHGGVEWQGDENYFVCPPEHIHHTGAALICYTKFRRVSFDELPDYVQAELLKLKFFNEKMCALKKNLWFGMTAKLDGTSTTKFLSAESDFLDQTYIINQLKKLIRDKEEGSKQKQNESPFILNIPDRR